MVVSGLTAAGIICRAAGRLQVSTGLDIPLFLCPALLGSRHRVRPSLLGNGIASASRQKSRCLHLTARPTTEHVKSITFRTPAHLPRTCAGCGAFSQSSDDQEAGFFSLTRRSVKTFLEGGNGPSYGRKQSFEKEDPEQAIEKNNNKLLESLRLAHPLRAEAGETKAPVCDRCHKLVHHQTGTSIYHPSIQSLEDTILESPHKYNHIYHVIDAADFPMSLIPGLHRLLNLTPQRSLNRRSKTGKFSHGKQTEVSFVITRSDLLAPLKTQVDSLMPYLTSVLRDALGSIGRDIRLGNVRCVSAKRGWWTKELKEDVWKRGGGGWMVGKVNVGKSQLFEGVFPKGRNNVRKLGNHSRDATLEDVKTSGNDTRKLSDDEPWNEAPLDNYSLLPPVQPETDYPAMPLVSALPGTTASPIRVPFGGGRGELVDLPGLSRGDLELFVDKPHRLSLVMRSRVVPEQQVIKPGQSLLIGGFIRITPITPNLIILGYAFTPISPHLTSTEKAIGIQKQEGQFNVENIALPGVGEKIASAGKFHLKWDVTKERSGPVTASDAAKIKVEKLPWKVLSVDILIEGCGWVELVAQVRRNDFQLDSPPPILTQDVLSEEIDRIDPQWPEVEVFSPEGKFIASRRPLGGWNLGKTKKPAVGTKGRPRPSMKGAKKAAKVIRRSVHA